jgi:polyribonucleotide 5'-hydroxyl-kinase
MRSYINAHAALSQTRHLAREQTTAGPKVTFPAIHVINYVVNNTVFTQVLIVGPPGTGKTSLSRILVNYAAREGFQPLLVDLDPREVIRK